MELILKKAENRLVYKKNRNALWGYIFIAPSITGFILFYLGPMIYSFIISFFKWDMVTPPVWDGIANYASMVNGKEQLVIHSLGVTLHYTAITVPLITVLALLVASLLNTKIKQISMFRTIFYIPSIVPAVANAALWMFLCNPMFGFFNSILGIFGIPPQNWIFDAGKVIPTLAVMAAWGSGNTAIIYLAALQGIPACLYESIDIDGGNALHKFLNITVPLISPVIFYNALMVTIGSMQTFTQAYIMTGGGPHNSSLFFVLLLYREAFKNQNMGLASAMSWVMFAIIVVLTLLAFGISRKLVYYGGGVENG